MSTPDYTRNFGDTAQRSGVRPEFFIDSILDQAASEREGRQIWKDEERVRMYMPGNSLHIPVEKVNGGHIERWPDQYKAFKAGVEPPIDGTPIEQWPVLSKGQVKELRYLNLRTVEDIAQMPDTTMQRIGMGGMVLRDMAKSFLDDSLRHALEIKLSKKADAQDIEIATLRNQVEELSKIATTLNTQLMQSRDAPNPLSTMRAMDAPIAVPPSESRVESALDKLAKRKPGRPSNAEKASKADRAA